MNQIGEMKWEAKEDYAGPMPDPLDKRLNITIKEWGRSLKNA